MSFHVLSKHNVRQQVVNEKVKDTKVKGGGGVADISLKKQKETFGAGPA